MWVSDTFSARGEFMSSKGTPRYTFRLPDELLAEIELKLSTLRVFSRSRRWTLSEFIRVACVERLKKMERSNRPRRKPAPSVPAIDGV